MVEVHGPSVHGARGGHVMDEFDSSILRFRLVVDIGLKYRHSGKIVIMYTVPLRPQC